jgi:glycosyltransferase involved in cell wall biosynthesis
MKRFDLLLRALAARRRPWRAVIAGEGPDRARLAALAVELGVADRVEWPGRVDDRRLVELYARALAVFYAPFDEDYGYVTLEAFRSERPVVTTADAGGVLEFVRDGENGFVCAPGAEREIAARFDRLFDERGEALRLGRAGAERVAAIGWDRVVERLLALL